MKKESRQLSLPFFVLVYLLFVVLDIDGHIIPSPYWHQVFGMLIYLVLACWGVWLFGFELKRNQKDFTNHLKKSLLLILSIGLAQILINILSSFLLLFLLEGLGIENTGLQNDANIAGFLSDFPIFVTLLIIGIMGPLVEELVFRKLLFGFFRKYLPVFVAILLQALLFGLLHINSFTLLEVINVIPHFLTGILYGFVYYKTDNLLYPLTVHGLINSLAILALLSTNL